MRWQVDLQRCRVWVGTVAVRTFIRLVFIVLPLVRLLGEKHRQTLIWELLTVNKKQWTRLCLRNVFRWHTDLEVRQLGKSLFTSGVSTFIRPIASVDSVTVKADRKCYKLPQNIFFRMTLTSEMQRVHNRFCNLNFLRHTLATTLMHLCHIYNKKNAKPGILYV